MGRHHEAEESCMFCNFRGSKTDLIDHLASDCEIDRDKEQRVSEPDESGKECGDVLDTMDDLRTRIEERHEGLKSCMEIVVHLASDCEKKEDEERMVCEPVHREICNKCGEVFGTEAELETHEKKYHGGSECCMFCPFKGSKIDLVAHLTSECKIVEDRKHEQEVSKPAHTCGKCGKSL